MLRWLQQLDLRYFPTSLLNETVWAASEQVRAKRPRPVPAFAPPDLISSEGTVRSSFRVARIAWEASIGPAGRMVERKAGLS